VCFDFETSSAIPATTQILSIGAAAIDPSTLEIIDEFYSLCKYEDWSSVQPKALEVNKLTKDELEKAPDIRIVFAEFVSFINKYNTGNSVWTAPVMCGQNIIGFDIPVMERYCQRFGPWDKKEQRQKLFRGFPVLDLGTMTFGWFENEKEPTKLNLGAIAKHLGFPQEQLDNTHNALEDVKITTAILIRFLKFQRNIMGQYRDKIKGCFNEKIRNNDA
jgi:DNA polymerase III epsilon subunit-like protein